MADTALGDIGDSMPARPRPRHPGRERHERRRATAGRSSTELDQLIDSIKTDGQHAVRRPLHLLGHATNTQPYQLGANDTYSGNTAMITREIGVGVQVAINTPGSSVIGDGTSGLLTHAARRS